MWSLAALTGWPYYDCYGGFLKSKYIGLSRGQEKRPLE